MLVKLVTNNGHEQTLNIQKIVSIDGVDFNRLQAVDLQSLHQRLTILEEAFTGLSDNMAEMISEIFPQPDSAPAEQDPVGD